MNIDWVRLSWQAMAAVFSLLFWVSVGLVILTLCGCGSETRAETRTEKRIVTVTKEIRQEISPTGEIVQLETVTRTTTSEDGQQIGQTETEIKQPQVVGMIAALAKAGAAVIGGPAAGQAAQTGIDLISTLLGTSAAVVPAGMGYVALRKRKSEADALKEELEIADRHRRQLVKSVEHARSVLTKDDDENFTTALAKKQDDDLQAYVQALTT
jgi:hypothetical protein